MKKQSEHRQDRNEKETKANNVILQVVFFHRVSTEQSSRKRIEELTVFSFLRPISLIYSCARATDKRLYIVM